MSLTVEDGTIVPNADSYVSVVDFQAYCLKRGMVVPVDPTACEALLTKAMDFLQGLRYIGNLVDIDQSLMWPRKNVYNYREGYYYPDNKIPKVLIDAQCQLGFIVQTIDLQPSQSADSKGLIQTESVYGAVSRTYFKKAGSETAPYLTSVNALLYDLVDFGLPGMHAINTFAIRS